MASAASSPSFFTYQIILGKKQCKRVLLFLAFGPNTALSCCQGWDSPWNHLPLGWRERELTVPFKKGRQPSHVHGMPEGWGPAYPHRHGKPPRRHSQHPVPPSRAGLNQPQLKDTVPGRRAGPPQGKAV